MAGAARVTDNHTCPLVNPSSSPHLGGPILQSGPKSVIINGLPAAIVGDLCVCAGPVDSISKGSSSVYINGMPAARMGDPTAHGGSITIASSNVIIGD